MRYLLSNLVICADLNHVAGASMEASKLKQHENLTGTNSLVVRQNRIDAGGSMTAEFNGVKYNVVNFSLFGLAIVSPQEMAIDSILTDVKVLCAGHQVSVLSFVVKRSKPHPLGFEIGLEALNESLPVTSISRLKDFNTIVTTIDERLEHYSKLPAQFKLELSELASRFEQFEKYTKGFADIEFANNFEFEEAREAMIATVSMQIKKDLDRALQVLPSSFGPEHADFYKTAFSYFREKMGRYMFQSPFTKRSYEKPRGYAGDYIMMTQIYANDSHAPSLFGSCMERAIQQFGEPSAVRNRSTYLCKKIISTVNSVPGEVKILSVACGPAEEIRRAVEELSQDQLDRCHFTLLDQDEGALQFAQKNILEFAFARNKKVKLKLMNRGIKEILVTGLGEVEFDLIYSAGLFDYFTDAVASRASKMFLNHVSMRGQLVIGNFNVATTNWFGMLAFFDWALILRGESDFMRLFNFGTHRMTIESEDNKINLFCCLTR